MLAILAFGKMVDLRSNQASFKDQETEIWGLGRVRRQKRRK